jgi:hypothetical protein
MLRTSPFALLSALPWPRPPLRLQDDLRAVMSLGGPGSEERLAVLQSAKAGLEEQVHRLNEDSKQVGGRRAQGARAVGAM